MFISGSSSNLSSSFVSLSKIQDDTEKLDFTKKGTYFGSKFRKRKPTEEDTRYTLLKKYKKESKFKKVHEENKHNYRLERVAQKG
jgi:hypothetical protein